MTRQNRQLIAATVTKALDYLEKDPETNIPKIMEMVDKVTPDGLVCRDREMRSVIPFEDTRSNWYQLILRICISWMPAYARAFFRNFIVNASLKGSATQEEGIRRE